MIMLLLLSALGGDDADQLAEVRVYKQQRSVYIRMIQKVKDAALVDHSILEELGLTAIERDLISIDPGYKAVSPTARLDSFLTEADKAPAAAAAS